MDKILSFLKSFDIDKIMPPIDQFLGSLKFWMVVLTLVGPLLMLALGLMYYYKPPKEANYSWGFRTYVTMGSVEVWQYTQKLAGRTWIFLGGAMAAVSLVLGVILCFFNAEAVVVYALLIVAVELVLVVGSWIGINLVVLKSFDKDGNRRKDFKYADNKFLNP